MAHTTAGQPAPSSPVTVVNEVHLIGRVTGPPVERDLPSGDRVVTVRVTLDRPARPAAPRAARRQVDTIDLACWSAPTREVTEQLPLGARVEVHGALRRRFYRAGPATLSRYEVEVAQLTAVLS